MCNKHHTAISNDRFYDGLRIQADIETHEFVGSYAKQHFSKNTRILDLAAGAGALSKRLLELGFDMSCTSWNDKSFLPISTFKINLDNPFGVKDLGGTRFPMVCAIEIIEHLENPSSFLRSCYDLVSTGGVLILSTPNIESAPARLQWLIHGCPNIFEVDEVKSNRHISMMWQQGLEHLIDLAGFRIVEKYLLGSKRLTPSLRSFVKQTAYRLMECILAGDIQGYTRLYVLAPRSHAEPKSAGPSDVW